MTMAGTFAELEAAKAQRELSVRKSKLGPNQRQLIVDLVTSELKIPAEVARLFSVPLSVHPCTIGHVLAEARLMGYDSPKEETRL